ncbi:Hypothetical predicted protein [Olea europaea subsp. europaea]|uniref:Uncharacterized protein n=1 Tax=Olea europaea subsp. europaea TaxID=158383 RepID=A0A8S0Q1Y8_OLEEU|nr:Hypothetical predicted protein [Olea europaea subsp. europaea]
MFWLVNKGAVGLYWGNGLGIHPEILSTQRVINREAKEIKGSKLSRGLLASPFGFSIASNTPELQVDLKIAIEELLVDAEVFSFCVCAKKCKFITNVVFQLSRTCS